MIRRMLNFVLSPQNALLKAWSNTKLGSFKLRLDYDAFPRPHYAYCVYFAAQQARALGMDRISVLEFGVAGGRGLMELERIVEEIEKEFGVEIEVWGFDTGEGLPEPEGFRDLPYIWQEGFFKMDQESLKSKLSRAKLVIGNVKDTVPSFVDEHRPAPLGAAIFDLDFWSSTCDSLQIFDGHEDTRLPRIFCYFDDVSSAEGGGLLNEYVGQLASIADYNSQNEVKKIAPIAGMRSIRKIQAGWNDKIYVHHDFSHPEYNHYIHSSKDRQLEI